MRLNARLFAAGAGLGLAAAAGSAGLGPLPAALANVPGALPAPVAMTRSYNAPEDFTYRIPIAKYVGTSTCASTDCHHKAEGKGHPGSEYSTWGAYDPHTKAYSVLFDERSVVMVRNYRASRGDVLPTGAVPEAHKDALCLKCHAVSPPPELARSGGDAEPNVRSVVEDGVGCEGCHGAGDLYRTTHYLDSFKTLSYREKAEKYGLWPTKDVAWRTKMCGTCHVGQADMEVNHDLIAAGHPVLKYETAGYHNIYPKHWPAEKGYGPDFQARNWAIGQVASAAQALDLLIYRAGAGKANNGSDGAVGKEHHAWPELSEYDCYACHRTIQSDTWRQGEGPRPGAALGTAAWGVWYTPALKLLAGVPGPFAAPAPGLREKLDRLAVLMQQPRPSTDEVIAAAKPVRDQLDLWARQLQADAERGGSTASPAPAADLVKLLDAFVAHGTAGKGDRANRVQDWDDATQTWLAVVALYQTFGDLDPAARSPRADAALYDARCVLKFPPREDGTFLDFPREFTPAKFREKLGVAGALVPRPAGR